jgi:hypothetical protein
VVACQYYLPEYATITGGCWTIDLWSTPQAASQNDHFDGNMKFYACGDTINPLYHEGLMVGWLEGSTIRCYSDAIAQDSTQLHMRALDSLVLDSVGTPSSGVGYYSTLGYWSTPDSLVKGKIEYFVPGHQDTSVLIEKVTLWNESGTTLTGFIVGEESDWDCDRDSALDAGNIDVSRSMVYMYGDHKDMDVSAGLSPFAYTGPSGNFAAMAINGYDYAYYSLGWYPDTMYNVMDGLDGLSVFADSTNGTEMRVINRFTKGSLGATDTIQIWKVKTVSLDGLTGLQALVDKGRAFALRYEGIINPVLWASESSIALTHYLPAKNPDGVAVSINETEFGFNVGYTVTADDGGQGWLVAAPTSGTTPGLLGVDYDAGVAEALGEGVYNGTVTIIAAAINDTVTIPVTLSVEPQPQCQGRCGDANEDGSVNVSDAVYVINYVFITGSPVPQPVKACGDANGDASVNVSDAVYVINYVFIVGSPSPGDCAIGAPAWGGLDCCAF